MRDPSIGLGTRLVLHNTQVRPLLLHHLIASSPAAYANLTHAEPERSDNPSSGEA